MLASDGLGLLQFLKIAQDRLLTTFGDYHFGPMVGGLGLLGAATALAFVNTRSSMCLQGTFLWRSVVFISTAYLASFFASSFVEEEHEFWFMAASSTLLVLAIFGMKRTVADRVWLVLAASSVRVMRVWSLNGTSVSARCAPRSAEGDHYRTKECAKR